MPESPLHQPHDKLFKATFGDPANAAALLRHELPPALSAAIDWEALRLESGSFIDSDYRQSESDLLFSVPLGDSRCMVYVLFEHQTSPAPDLAFRLLGYQFRIWERLRNELPKGSLLPVILPVVLAQSADVWQIRPQFSPLFDIPAQLASELEPFIPDFTFRLIQLAEIPFDAIRGTPAGILTLRVMKAERLEKLLEDVVWDEALFVKVSKEAVEMLLRYILNADIDKSAFARRVEQVSTPEIKEVAMTLAQQYRQEGRLIAGRTAVVSALEIRFKCVPEGLREEIIAITDEARLKSLLRGAIECASLEDFSSLL